MVEEKTFLNTEFKEILRENIIPRIETLIREEEAYLLDLINRRVKVLSNPWYYFFGKPWMVDYLEKCISNSKENLVSYKKNLEDFKDHIAQ